MTMLKTQADRIAARLKALERGEDIAVDDPANKIATARTKESITFGVAMDDKILKITMPWSAIRDTTEAGIAEYILNHMSGGGPKPT